MGTLLKISWRSLWRHRLRTAITVSAIALALTLNVWLISFGDGVYDKMIFDAVRQNAGHITLENPDYRDAPAIDLTVSGDPDLRERLRRIEGVERTKALILGQGVVKSGAGAVGVALMAVEPDTEAATSPLAHKIADGSYLANGDKRRVVIGAALAERLDLDVGKKLVVSTNDANGQLVEELLRVKGIFSTGAAEIDGYVVQMPLPFARELYELDRNAVTQLGIVVADPENRDQVLAQARTLVGDNVAVLPWEEVMPEVAAYIRLDGGSNLIFQGILLFLSLFTIFNTILMSVLERTREFAVQLALGVSPWRIRAQVLVESTLIGLLGGAVGLTTGGLLGYYFEVYGLDISKLYGEGLTVSGVAIDSQIYGKVTAELLVVLGVVVVTATILVSLISMRRISRISVATVLR
jgi:ABC-type lipoprotein release transport system permease subunit